MFLFALKSSSITRLQRQHSGNPFPLVGLGTTFSQHPPLPGCRDTTQGIIVLNRVLYLLGFGFLSLRDLGFITFIIRVIFLLGLGFLLLFRIRVSFPKGFELLAFMYMQCQDQGSLPFLYGFGFLSFHSLWGCSLLL